MHINYTQQAIVLPSAILREVVVLINNAHTGISRINKQTMYNKMPALL
jgi:hypothetical protein